jgi:hypothetical protein
LSINNPHRPRRRIDVDSYTSGLRTPSLPPMMWNSVEFDYHVFKIDPDRVRPFLPHGLQLTDDCVGVTALCKVLNAEGLPAHSQAFGAVVVQDHESPDGSEGAYMLFNFVSSDVLQVYAAHYDRNALAGEVALWEEGAIGHAAIRIGNSDILEIDTRVEPTVMQGDGIDLYLSRGPDEVLLSYSVSYWGSFRRGQTIGFRISPNAPAAVRAMEPIGYFTAQRLFDFRGIWSLPSVIAKDVSADEIAQRGFIEALRLAPHAAVLLNDKTEVIHMNPHARQLIGPEVSRAGGKLRPILSRQGDAARQLVELSTGRLRISTPFLLDIGSPQRLLAQGFAIRHGSGSQPQVLVLILDALQPNEGNPLPRLS